MHAVYTYVYIDSNICGDRTWNHMRMNVECAFATVASSHKNNHHCLRHQKFLPLYTLCSETIVQKFPTQQVNLAAQYQLLRRGSTAPLRVQTNGKFNGLPKFPITKVYTLKYQIVCQSR